ncbi:NADH:flavin oxidoreductase/NADH oxidase [Variovorax sp. J22P168]|uniref:NADH:flavin oxidoreductase/NADH oxidase n=1 Tax=Variovorax jilinensis TaxID=3053513 RepID=UPI0025768126|nr:NADH:flavin oxidoreductase/NADH oxidase [Variovorax sp. J22P168]MDM0015171.1 NADH:flavin oxidoreductase/NADH oxidase [Variovorax sp. J22P168]
MSDGRRDEAGPVPHLFSPLCVRGVTLRNRVVVSPMATYRAQDGVANDWHLAHFGKFALGGAGLVFTEAIKVDSRGLGTVGDMGLWDDAQVPALARIARFVRSQGAVAGVQLNHAGRKAGTSRPWEGFGPLDRSRPVEGREHWPVLGPSAIPFMEGWPVPEAMSEAQVREAIAAFGQAARRADEAGFQVIELHGAHGYLLHQFLSPASNQRTDRWGGSAEKRMRFVLEVVDEVRRHWPADKALFYRIASQDDAGWTLDDSVSLARRLAAVGVDAIDCSAGGISGRTATAGGAERPAGFQVPFAEYIRREADMPTLAVGLILDAVQAQEVIAEGRADMVAIGREMLYDPFWAAHAARTLGVESTFEHLPLEYSWWLARRKVSPASERIVNENP